MPQKRTPQSPAEMLEEQSGKRGNRMYNTKQESREYTASELATITRNFREQLDQGSRERISLSDLDAVQRQAWDFLRACETAGTLPTTSGLARCLGVTNEALRIFKVRHPNHPTTDFLTRFGDYCGDVLAEAALQGLTQPVFSIFVLKARNGWQDTVRIETAPPDPLGAEISAEEIVKKYGNLPDLDE